MPLKGPWEVVVVNGLEAQRISDRLRRRTASFQSFQSHTGWLEAFDAEQAAAQDWSRTVDSGKGKEGEATSTRATCRSMQIQDHLLRHTMGNEELHRQISIRYC